MSLVWERRLVVLEKVLEGVWRLKSNSSISPGEKKRGGRLSKPCLFERTKIGREPRVKELASVTGKFPFYTPYTFLHIDSILF